MATNFVRDGNTLEFANTGAAISSGLWLGNRSGSR
jgi:predicted RecA/RadA family phage recombinase